MSDEAAAPAPPMPEVPPPTTPDPAILAQAEEKGVTPEAVRVEAATEPVCPTPDPSAPTIPNLRRDHLELLQAWGKLDTPDRHERAEAFRLKLTAAGAHLEEITERDAAQGMVDYWTATLAGLPSHEGFPELMVLAPFKESNRIDLKKIVTSPFVGLNAFSASDKERFFGRLTATDQLIARVVELPVVVVAGASGSGKSSLLFAGLVPKLADHGGWHILPSVMPGNDPIAALLQSFRPASAPPGWLDGERDALTADPQRLVALADTLGPQPLMLPVDQGEEIFTFEVDVPTRLLFFTALAALADAGHDHRLVITIRSDYLKQLLDTTVLFAGREPEAIVYTIEPLTSRELQDAITGPAQRIGLKIDPRVVENLVRDVVGEPAALPLIQFTLTRLWGRADQDRITWEDYEAVGRPADALRQAAEEVWNGLQIDENRDAARRIFLEMVRSGIGAESVRGGRVRREALRKLAASDRIDKVLARFVAAGLIRRTPGVEIDDDRFEVAHETLIRQWPRLVGWLDRRSRDNEQVERLMASADLWRNSGDRGYLLDGEALREASLAVAANPQLTEYVAASRRWRDLRQRRRITIVAVALTMILIAGVAYYIQRSSDSRRELARSREEAGLVVDADLVGASAEARAQIAEQTLSRLLDVDPALLAFIPTPLQSRVAAVPIPPLRGWLGAARGYDPNFLGVEVPLPRSAAPVTVLPYVNFSAGYDAALKTPRFVISNFDRAAVAIPPLTMTGFVVDPRVPGADQPAAFAGLDPDVGRVPLVGWREIGWQSPTVRPIPRNDPLTASGVQPWVFNQGRWSLLERTLLSVGADRITFITGPVIPETDPGQPTPQPRAFWKVAIYRDDSPQGVLHADAYVVPIAEPKTIAPIRSYQVDIAVLSRITGLDFRLPRAAPPPVAATTTAAAPTPALAVTGGPVFLQFAQMSRGDARGISDALGKVGFHVPGEERVSVLGLHEVRYYHPQDADRAGKLATAAQEVLAAQGYGAVKIGFRLMHLKGGPRLPKPGVLELWLTIPPPPTP